MKQYVPLLIALLVLAAQPAAAREETAAGTALNHRLPGVKTECDSSPALCIREGETCRQEMRGRCGKRRGDWYGASQPVTSAADARKILLNYFSGQEYTVSGVTEKKWGFRADIIDKSGVVIDRVMIDKRFGRIRSLY